VTKLAAVAPEPSETREITAFVAGVRRRLLRRSQVRWVGTGGAVALGLLLLLAVGGGVFGPSAAWRSIVTLVLGGGAGTLAVFGARDILRRRSDEFIARQIGDRLPGLGDDVWSALELERELPRIDADGLLSPELVRAHRARVAFELRSIDPRALVALEPRRLWPLVGVAALFAIMMLAWPAGMRRGFSAMQPFAEPVATSNEPIVGDLELTLQYPKYTELPPRVIPGSSGHVLALPGTRVTVNARALVAAGREATLELTPEGDAAKELPVEVRDQKLAAAFDVRGRGSYRFILGAGSRRVREPDAHRIDVEPDRAPRVDLFAPADPLEVPGPRRVELAWSVDDDYGLGAVTLVWKAGENAPQRREIGRAEGKRAASGKFEWDLAELDLKAGVHVAYWLEALDNDTEPKPNVGRSKTLTLLLTDPHAQTERALDQLAALLDEMVQLLGDRLEARAPTDDALADRMGTVHLRGEGLLLMMTRAEQSLNETKRSKDEKLQLAEMHARLGRVLRDEEQLLNELRDKRRKTGQPLKGVAHALDAKNQVNVAELERDIIAVDDLMGKQRLEELLALADEMAHARDRLKQLMQQYKQSRSPEVKKEIERELKALERKLAELSQKASKLASELPDQFLNAEAMGKNDLSSEMQKIRDLLDKGDVNAAMAALEKMSQSLDRMTSSMENDLRGYRDQRFSAEEKAMAEAENKLSDLAQDEKQLRDETEAVRQRARDAAQKLMKDRVDSLVKKERDKIAKLKKQLDDVDPLALSPYDQDEMGRIKRRVDDTDRALAEKDLDEARGMARAAHELLRNLAMDLHDENARAWKRSSPKSRKTQDQVGNGEMTAREIADELDKAMPSPSQMMSPEDQKRLGELGKRQASVKKRAQELSRELGKPRLGADGKPMPSPVPRDIGGGLGEAGQHMERAEDELRGQRPRDAVGEEAQALDRLQKMRDELQQQRRPRDQQSSGRIDKEPVRIPGADEFRAPKEFRQDLLEAMKRGAPSEYKEQLKKYYEELAK
jgi:hypothetical protein